MEGKNYIIIDTPRIVLNPFKTFLNLFKLIFVILKSIFYLKKEQVDILISTGGYMSLPLCFAAKILGLKLYLFEPNMVLGRANKIFLKYSKKIFCYSKNIINFPKKYFDKISIIEPLLRKNFYSLKYNETKQIKKKINFLIVGGSQGAKLFDNQLNEAIIKLSKRYELKIFHQTSLKNFENLKNFYSKNAINFKLFDFENNLFDKNLDINLCISRAGASTLSELTFLNIPYLTIPLPSAKDDHQYYNAIFYKNKNCCWMLKQEDLRINVLFNNLLNIIENKEDYLAKRISMKEISSKNTWNDTNQKLISVINEN